MNKSGLAEPDASCPPTLWEVLRRYQPVEEDTPLKALQASQIQEEDYFCHVTHKDWDAILHDILKAHKGDAESAPYSGNSLKTIRDVCP